MDRWVCVSVEHSSVRSSGTAAETSHSPNHPKTPSQITTLPMDKQVWKEGRVPAFILTTCPSRNTSCSPPKWSQAAGDVTV